LTAFQNVLRHAPRLQWLHIHPAGAERPIYVELRRRGVKVTTSSGATASTVAQSAAGALLGHMQLDLYGSLRGAVLT